MVDFQEGEVYLGGEVTEDHPELIDPQLTNPVIFEHDF